MRARVCSCARIHASVYACICYMSHVNAKNLLLPTFATPNVRTENLLHVLTQTDTHTHTHSHTQSTIWCYTKHHLIWLWDENTCRKIYVHMHNTHTHTTHTPAAAFSCYALPSSSSPPPHRHHRYRCHCHCHCLRVCVCKCVRVQMHVCVCVCACTRSYLCACQCVYLFVLDWGRCRLPAPFPSPCQKLAFQKNYIYLAFQSAIKTSNLLNHQLQSTTTQPNLYKRPTIHSTV